MSYGQTAMALDVPGVQPAALDQPRINAYLSLTPEGEPQNFDGFFNIQAFFDTGASGVLLSSNTAGYLGIDAATAVNPSTSLEEPIVFTDVGANSSTAEFNVSAGLTVGLAPYQPDADVDNIATFSTVYNQKFNGIRTQIGPFNPPPDPSLEDLDVFGIPLMAGKVVVMDPKPVNTFLDTMRTYVYNPTTPYDETKKDYDPGIPATSLHVKLSYGSFDRFTTVTPAGAAGPTLADNPFIGPNPADPDPNDHTPPVTITYANQQAAGSFLLDTGAAASILSKHLAADLGITYKPGTEGTDSPVLLGVPEDEQFTIPIGGISGISTMAGFYLDSLTLPTQEGSGADPSNANNIHFQGAPMLVGDITVHDPATNQDVTLDGVFGMNFLVASVFLTGSAESLSFGGLTFGRFDWVTFDQPNGVLGLEPLTNLGTQGTLNWFGALFDTESDWDIDNSENWITGLTLAGYHDGDHVLFNDFAWDSTIILTDPVAPGSVEFDNSDGADYTIRGNFPIQGYTGLTKRGAGGLFIYNSNTYTGPTDIVEGTVNFVGSQNIGPVNVHTGAVATFEASQRFEELNLVGGLALFTPGTGKLLVVDELTLTGAGQLDLVDASMVIHKGSVASVRSALKSGYNGGTWDGAGIVTTSTLAARVALGYAAGDDPVIAYLHGQFKGEDFDSSAVIIKLTYFGDGNLDGSVDGSDVALWAQNFTGALGSNPANPRRWTQGDWNYDGSVDGSDVAFWAQNFTGALGGGGLGGLGIDAPGLSPAAIALLSGMGIGVVPEPASMSVLALAVLGLARRRRSPEKGS